MKRSSSSARLVGAIVLLFALTACGDSRGQGSSERNAHIWNNVTASAPRYVFQTVTGVIVTSTITTTRDIPLPPATQIIFAPRVGKNMP